MNAGFSARPEISVYWKPGCSMCLKAKEFLEEKGIAFESLNVIEDDAALAELGGEGLRSLPVIRQGRRYMFVQSIETVSDFLGLARSEVKKLSRAELLLRWDDILGRTAGLVAALPEDVLHRRANLSRDRSVLVLASHVFQIPETWIITLDQRVVVSQDFQDEARPDIRTRAQLLDFIARVRDDLRRWIATRGVAAIPERLTVYYGDHPSDLVLERSTWHSAQHARQLDAVAVGLGAEYAIPAELYAGLPMPKRIWA